METSIISPSLLYQNVLLEAFGEMFSKTRTASSFNDLGQVAPCDVVLYAPMEGGFEVPDNMNIIGFMPEGITLTEAQKQHYLMVFQAPIRLGSIKRAIESYAQQRRQRDQLKSIIMGDYVLNPKTNQITHDQTKASFRLTEKEQDILLYLNAQNGTPVSRQDLLDHVWQYAKGVETHTLETHIYRLRQKIEADPALPKFLMTNEAGYFLNLSQD